MGNKTTCEFLQTSQNEWFLVITDPFLDNPWQWKEALTIHGPCLTKKSAHQKFASQRAGTSSVTTRALPKGMASLNLGDNPHLQSLLNQARDHHQASKKTKPKVSA